MKLRLLLFLLLATAGVYANDAGLQTLTFEADALKQEFNVDKNQSRLVVILSPT